MSETPPNVDPELLIIGEGSCDNLRTWKPTLNEREFRIDPRPMPLWSIVLQNALIVALSCVLQWVFLKAKLAGDVVPKYTIPILGGFLCVANTLIAVPTHQIANKRGTRLIYDLKSDRVDLPHEGEKFARTEIVHLQYITTRTGFDEARSELNLITLRNGKRERWPILRSSRAYRPFDSVLRPLVAQTGLPVVRVTDGYKTGEIRQNPWKSN
jgi:hypothetical protein